MKYEIAKEVFDLMPDACFGTVVAKGIDNTKTIQGIEQMLKENITECEKAFEGIKVKESGLITPYRDAFRSLGINPNKFMCSIEALLTRIAKGKGFPFINPLVDLNNAVSIKYRLPMGTHDIDTMKDDLMVRFAVENDTFVPFGSNEPEKPDEDELVYVCGNEVRTRRWTWRQSEVGKITENTNSVFFPIDGFTGINDDKVIAARDELAEYIEKFFSVTAVTDFVNIDKNYIQL